MLTWATVGFDLVYVDLVDFLLHLENEYPQYFLPDTSFQNS